MVPASPGSTGMIRAMGRSQGTVAARIIPGAGIFPTHSRPPGKLSRPEEYRPAGPLETYAGRNTHLVAR
jgi:hypothetical protein